MRRIQELNLLILKIIGMRSYQGSSSPSGLFQHLSLHTIYISATVLDTNLTFANVLNQVAETMGYWRKLALKILCVENKINISHHKILQSFNVQKLLVHGRGGTYKPTDVDFAASHTSSSVPEILLEMRNILFPGIVY